jgi:hypothetical protein
MDDISEKVTGDIQNDSDTTVVAVVREDARRSCR